MFESLLSWLVTGSLLLGMALVLFMWLFRIARRSPDAWVVKEVVLSSVFAPLIVVLIVFGGGAMTAAWTGRAASPVTAGQLTEAAIVVGIALVLAALLKRGVGSGSEQPSPRAPVAPLPPQLDRAA